jgi:[ribosomal protein S5]-alanine N-acetyltransferase
MKTLRTPRLVLAPVHEDDVTALHDHWTEPDVRRFLWDGKVISRDQVREVIATSHRLFGEHDVGLWSIRPATDPGIVGCAGFWHFHHPPELELLISLSSSHWGRGLALEAAGALLTYTFRELDWAEVQASTDTPNAASLRLMQRLGMQPAGKRPGEFGSIEVFRIRASEWPEPPDVPSPLSA